MIQYTQITYLISELLYKHDCVIVPKFGGFVARNYSAGFSKGNSLLFPPTKQVLFNKNLVHNDGLLVSALMEKNTIPFDDATKHIEDYKAYIESLLDAKKRFELIGIGLLYLDSEQSLRFEAKPDINFLFDSYGFEPVTAIELAIESEAPFITPVFENRRAIVEPVQKQKRPYAKIAALAVGIPAAMAFLLMATYSKPMQPFMQSSVNPFYSPEKTYSPDKEATRNIYFIDDVAKPALLADANGYAAFTLIEKGTVLIVNINDTVVKADKTLVHKPLFTSSSEKNYTGKFEVVLGCFGIKRNADKLIGELTKNNISAGISGVNNKGLHIVSCGGFDDKQAAVALLETVRTNYPNAWIMAK